MLIKILNLFKDTSSVATPTPAISNFSHSFVTTGKQDSYIAENRPRSEAISEKMKQSEFAHVHMAV